MLIRSGQMGKIFFELTKTILVLISRVARATVHTLPK